MILLNTILALWPLSFPSLLYCKWQSWWETEKEVTSVVSYIHVFCKFTTWRCVIFQCLLLLNRTCNAGAFPLFLSWFTTACHCFRWQRHEDLWCVSYYVIICGACQPLRHESSYKGWMSSSPGATVDCLAIHASWYSLKQAAGVDTMYTFNVRAYRHTGVCHFVQIFIQH